MPIEKLMGLFNLRGTYERIKHFDDDDYYDVWRVQVDDKKYIIKKTKEFEADIYNTIFKEGEKFVPEYFGKAYLDGNVLFENEYIMIENIEGENLNYCTREKLIKFLDALIFLQDKYWQNETFNNICYNVKNSLLDRIERGKFIKDEKIERYYEKYLNLYKNAPRTLCNDDMLPFNALVNEENSVIIDWEESGILPYLNSFARFISHTEEKADALFYMKEADKAFAVEYYYEHLLKKKGIEYQEYREQLNLFTIYEYCEWIMLYNKYENASREMYEKYKAKAYKLIDDIESEN